MTCKFCFSAFVVFQVSMVLIRGQQYCLTDLVQNIVLHDNHILSWDPAPNQTCATDHYLITILRATFQEDTFVTKETMLDVDYLEKCETVWITIAGVSVDNVRGLVNRHYTKTSAPPDVNLDLSFLRIYPYSSDILMLEWDIAEEWKECAREFRVVVYNEDLDIVQSTLYMPYYYEYIRNIVPCTSYVFTVTALHSLEEEGQVSVLRYTSPSAKTIPPTAERITAGTTTIDMTFIFQNATYNRCPINALVVDGSPYFNISYPVTGENQITRPPVNVHLTNLQPNTMYILRIFANNTAGFTNSSIIGVQTKNV